MQGRWVVGDDTVASLWVPCRGFCGDVADILATRVYR